MAESEIYPNATVVLVAVELRHPVAGEISQASHAKIKQAFGDRLPVQRETQIVNVQGTLGSQPEVDIERAPKYFSRELSTAVTYRREAIVVETTVHECYAVLRDLVALAIEVRQLVEPVAGVERMGLRYIDEMRVPENGEVPSISWKPWLNSTLLGPSTVEAAGLQATQWQGVTVFEPASERAIVLRYGPRDGYAVDPAGELKRQAPPPGPFFLLDIDSFWTPSGSVPEVAVSEMLTICDELHAPVRTLFESLITDRFRDEVLRNAS